MGTERKKPRKVKRDLANMTQKEVGDLFGVSLQAVQSIEYRAIRKLRNALVSDPDVLAYFGTTCPALPSPAKKGGKRR